MILERRGSLIHCVSSRRLAYSGPDPGPAGAQNKNRRRVAAFPVASIRHVDAHRIAANRHTAAVVNRSGNRMLAVGDRRRVPAEAKKRRRREVVAVDVNIDPLHRARPDVAFATVGWASLPILSGIACNELFPPGPQGVRLRAPCQHPTTIIARAHSKVLSRMVLRPSALERDHAVRTFREDQQIMAIVAGFAAAHRPTGGQSGKLHGGILS